MSERAVLRVRDMKTAILRINRLLEGKSREDAEGDFITGAAFERFLEVVSEASRHVPDEWKQEFGPDIPWREIAGIGNVLRHAYRTVAMRRLWLIYEADLDSLEAVVDAMLAAHDRYPGDDAPET